MLEGARNSRPWSASVYSANAAPPRAHDLVADFDALGVRSKLGDLAGPFHAEHGADASGRSVGVAFGHAEIGAIETAGLHANQHLRALRCGFCNL
jgi:hypothetical protein